MCAPVAVAAVVAAMQAKSAKDQADYQAGVEKNNATLAEYARRDAIQRGAYEARDIEIAGRREGAAARTAAAASGVAGTSVDNAAMAATLYSAVDAARTKANAAREAWGFEAERDERKSRAEMLKRAGYLGAASAIGSGVGSAASSYAASRSANRVR